MNTVPNIVSQMLTVPQYAATLEGNPTPTTVYRWIKDGKLPQAVEVDGVTMVPEGTPRPGKGSGTVARIAPTTTTVVIEEEPEDDEEGVKVLIAEYADEFFDRPVRDYLDRLPAAVPIKLAAILLGRSQKYITENPEKYEVEKNGPRSSWVIPRRVIMAEFGA